MIEDHKIRVKLSKLKEARDQGRKTEFDFKHFLKDNKLNHDIKDIYDDYLKLKFDYKNGE